MKRSSSAFHTITATLALSDGSTETVTANWLIGCDGYHSTVRKKLNIDYQGHDLKQHFIMIDAPLKWPLPNDQVALFPHQLGPVACFPMKDSCRTIIEVSANDNFAKSTPLTRKLFIEQLKQRWPFEFELGEARWMSQFSIHERLATHYRQGRAFLAGDAAHVHSPAGGQGMNTGMQDAYNLAWKLALVIKGQADPQLLNSYEAERRPVAHDVLASSDKLTTMATLKSSPLIWLRNWFLKHIASHRTIQKKFANQITGLGVNYPQSSLSKDFNNSRSLKAGMRAPTVIKGTRYQLFISAACTELTAIKALIDSHYAHLVTLTLVTQESSLAKQYQLAEGYCLIRPDQYIASFGKLCNELDSYLKSNAQLLSSQEKS